MRILVIGCGSIGRRHIRLLREMGIEVEGCEMNAEAAQAATSKLNIPVWTSIDWALKDLAGRGSFRGVIIATPPDKHYENMAEVAHATKVPILVEKPLVADWPKAPVAFPNTLCVGYNLRFHPGLQHLGQLLDEGAIGTVRHAAINCGSYLPDWRPGFDYRQGYAAKRDQGGGVLLDCSHEIDYACWLLGKPESVYCVAQNTGALDIETEDIADLVIRFKGGVQANIHLDYLDLCSRRECTVTGDNGSAHWNFKDGGSIFVCARRAHGRDDYWDISARPPCWEPDDMYRAELRNFLAVIEGKEVPVCTGEDGLRALQVAMAAHRSSEEGRAVTLE